MRTRIRLLMSFLLVVVTLFESTAYAVSKELIDSVHHKGKSSYTGEFKTSPENGKYLNVYCKNNAPETVYMTIKRNNIDFVSDIAIASGGQRTQTFEELYGEGLTGDWKVYIYTTDGHEMNLQVSARQY